MSSVLNRKARRDKSGLSEEERRKAYEAGFKAGTKWAVKKATNEAVRLTMYQMLVILESEFNFSSRKNGTGKLDKTYLEFLNKIIELNNDVDNFARDVMKNKLEENTGIGIRDTEDGLMIINLSEANHDIS